MNIIVIISCFVAALGFIIEIVSKNYSAAFWALSAFVWAAGSL